MITTIIEIWYKLKVFNYMTEQRVDEGHAAAHVYMEDTHFIGPVRKASVAAVSRCRTCDACAQVYARTFKTAYAKD